jgi:hypothetical protein
MRLPTYSGTLEDYSPDGRAAGPARAEVPLTRTAFAAAHVISDPLAERNPWDTRPAVDWDATLAFRHGLWDQGLGSGGGDGHRAARHGRGLGHGAGVDPANDARPRAPPLKPRVACGAGTDHKTPADLADADAIIAAYAEQMEAIEAAGGQIILMATRACRPSARMRTPMRKSTTRSCRRPRSR